MHSTHQELLQRPLHPPPITIILMITGLVHLSGEIRDQNLIVQHTIIVGRKRQQVKGERGFMDAAPSVGNLHHLNIMQNIHFAFKLFFISSSRSLSWVVVINGSSTCNSLTFHLQLLDCLKSQKRTTTTSVIFSRTASISQSCCRLWQFPAAQHLLSVNSTAELRTQFMVNGDGGWNNKPTWRVLFWVMKDNLHSLTHFIHRPPCLKSSSIIPVYKNKQLNGCMDPLLWSLWSLNHLSAHQLQPVRSSGTCDLSDSQFTSWTPGNRHHRLGSVTAKPF